MANNIVANNFWAVALMDPQPVLTPAPAAGPPGADGSGGPGGPDGDRPGRVEVRGIDHIPDAERHGRPRELFWVWFAANITYLYFVLGGVVLLLGLTLWQSVLVLVVGNLYWVGVGTLAISGPPSGTPSVVVTRAMYGVRGNRPFSAGIGWLVAIAYEAVNLALGALAGFALADHAGLTVSGPVKVIVLLVTAAVTFAVSIFGHATIVRLSPYFTAVLATVMVLLAVFVLQGGRHRLRTGGPTARRGPVGHALDRRRDHRLRAAVLGQRRRLRALSAPHGVAAPRPRPHGARRFPARRSAGRARRPCRYAHRHG